MALSETIYSFRVETPDYIERARTQTLKLAAYYQGSLVAPASGTFTLYDATGAAVVSAAAVTITSSIATYSLSSATIPASTPLGAGWLEEWALTMPDGTVRTPRRMAAIALRELFPPVTLSDALALHAKFSEILTDSQDPTGWDKLLFAWSYLHRKILAKGNKPWKILNVDALFDPLIYKWLELGFRDARTSMGDGTYKELAEEYRQMFEEAWKETQLVYDQDEDGKPTADQETKSPDTPVFLSAAKPGSYRTWGWR